VEKPKNNFGPQCDCLAAEGEAHAAFCDVTLDSVISGERSRGAESDYVGVAEKMPGTNGGFTMAAFTAEAVPPGTKLYIAPQKSVYAADFYEWYEKRYGKVDRTDVLAHAQRADAHEVWNAAIASLVTKSVRVNRGALQLAINMLQRDAEEGRVVRGELAEELARSVTGD
jgi:hypothetical protein